MPTSQSDQQPTSPAALPQELITRIKDNVCRHCGGTHVRACPKVRRMAFHANGSLAEVEFWRDDQWSDAHVIWPEDLTTTTEGG